MNEPLALQGIGVSEGIAFGRAVLVRQAPGPDPAEPASTDPQTDAARVREALEGVAANLRARANAASGEAREILLMTSQLAMDRGLAKAIEKKLGAGTGVTRALHEAVNDYVVKLQKLGGYMAQRSTDLHDVRDRAICLLRGLPAPGVPTMTSPGIIVAQDLAPAETAMLDLRFVQGIITAEGGPTSHTAIIASGRGIPAVVRAAGISDVAEGIEVALDGSSGEVIIAPTEQQRASFTQRAELRCAALDQSHGPGRTACGQPVALLANVGSPEDALVAAQKQAEGIGLFRTEFLFLDRREPPGLAEQTEAYTRVLQAFPGRRVVIRTLDAGADKPLAFADLGPEENPALGRRGLRLSQAREELLQVQLQALAAAQEAVEADLRVMAPMVSTVEEARWFSERARTAGLRSVGIMIETPAAAIMSGHVLEGLDFGSLGTNDLTQYTMAADRMQGELADLLSPWQPAVLHMVRAACRGGQAASAQIGVCGEAAGDPLLALVLVGLGVSSLSMSTGRIPAVRAALARHSLEDCRRIADAALVCGSVEEAREAVRAAVDPEVLPLAR